MMKCNGRKDGGKSLACLLACLLALLGHFAAENGCATAAAAAAATNNIAVQRCLRLGCAPPSFAFANELLV